MFIQIDEWSLILKNGRKKSFSYETKASMSFIPIRRMSYVSQLWKERRLLREFVFIQIDKQTLILKNGGKRSFSYETKALMSFMPMSGMSYSAQSGKKRDYN